ncbi:MAG TPA: beta-1,3-glucanase family protein [Gemmatimonadaceae bacterium]
MMRLRHSLAALAGAAVIACAGAGSTSPDVGDPATSGDFWDRSNIPQATQVMTFKFLNRTNGKFKDSEVYWSFKSGSISELHSIAERPTYDMPANSSGRMYFYLCAAGSPTNCTGDPSKSKYYDFIEHTIGPRTYNGNTTRVDAFGLKIALLLHCADGFEATVGEDDETFREDREVTFQTFRDAVPAEFKHLAEAPFAPYRIVQPGAGQFKTGGLYAHYYDDFVDAVWAANGLTVPKPGPNGSGLASYPSLSAAIYRHVGATPGTFSPDGKLLRQDLWRDQSSFYKAAPANYYAKFWHDHSRNAKAYGFPYDDVGSYSTYVSHTDPQYMLVAIGW